jgi:hypothetical protein
MDVDHQQWPAFALDEIHCALELIAIPKVTLFIELDVSQIIVMTLIDFVVLYRGISNPVLDISGTARPGDSQGDDETPDRDFT